MQSDSSTNFWSNSSVKLFCRDNALNSTSNTSGFAFDRDIVLILLDAASAAKSRSLLGSLLFVRSAEKSLNLELKAINSLAF